MQKAKEQLHQKALLVLRYLLQSKYLAELRVVDYPCNLQLKFADREQMPSLCPAIVDLAIENHYQIKVEKGIIEQTTRLHALSECVGCAEVKLVAIDRQYLCLKISNGLELQILGVDEQTGEGSWVCSASSEILPLSEFGSPKIYPLDRGGHLGGNWNPAIYKAALEQMGEL